MSRNLRDWIAETPESIGARLEGARETQRQTRFTLGIMALVSMMMLILSYNAYLSFDSMWAIERLSHEVSSLDQADTVHEILTAQALIDWARSRNATIELLGIQVSVDDAPVLGTVSLLVLSLWLLLVTRRENHTVGLLLRDTDTRLVDEALAFKNADVEEQGDMSFGQRWLILHSLVANNLFIAFDASMQRIESLRGDGPLWLDPSPSWRVKWRRSALTFAKAFFFWFPCAVSMAVFLLDRWSYFMTDPFLPVPPDNQAVGSILPIRDAQFFIASGLVFAMCWLPLFACCRWSARFSNATGMVLQEYASKLRSDLLRRESARHQEHRTDWARPSSEVT